MHLILGQISAKEDNAERMCVQTVRWRAGGGRLSPNVLKIRTRQH
ncbi:MAG: hypothetical protein ACK53Y_14475 [bacterium]